MFVDSSKNKYGPSESELSILKVPILCFLNNERLMKAPQTIPIININTYNIFFSTSFPTHLYAYKNNVVCCHPHTEKYLKKERVLVDMHLRKHLTFWRLPHQDSFCNIFALVRRSYFLSILKSQKKRLYKL